MEINRFRPGSDMQGIYKVRCTVTDDTYYLKEVTNELFGNKSRHHASDVLLDNLRIIKSHGKFSYDAPFAISKKIELVEVINAPTIEILNKIPIDWNLSNIVEVNPEAQLYLDLLGADKSIGKVGQNLINDLNTILDRHYLISLIKIERLPVFERYNISIILNDSQ